MSEPHRRVYLDFNATAPLRPAVRVAVLAAMDRVGNASSVHAEGRAARAAIEIARGEVARLLAAPAEGVTFTSGATEAAALALSPGLSADGQPATRLIVGATEHPAVRRGHRFGSSVDVVPVDRRGIVDLAALDAVLAMPGRAVVALQAANGETGVIQPVAEVARRVHAAGGLLVCDATQALGRIDCRALGADVALVSGHKIGGPAGVGAVVACRDGLRFGEPLLRGGGQERGLRGGTENGPAIVGFGVAAALVADLGEAAETGRLRQRLEARLCEAVPDLVIFGADVPRLPSTTAFAVPGIANEGLMIALDLAGFAVSTGSACSSGKVSRSDVLEAMGVDAHLRDGMIRVSLGWSSAEADVDSFAAAFEALVRRRQGSPARAAA